MNGIIILDKPAGLSSNQAMGKLKHLLAQRKMGFLGTLDPLATGVLPVFLDKATKLIPLFEGLEKQYQVGLRLGETTDTLDSQGTVREVRDIGGLSPDAVREMILSFDGRMVQRTPEYSAIKINGVPAYKMARKGQQVPEHRRQVELSDMEVEWIDLPLAAFRVQCSAGTYMRALAAEIGDRLGVGAHVSTLRRLRCGNLFTIENSFNLEQITCAVGEEVFDFIRNPGDFLADHAPVTVSETMEARLRNGQPVTIQPSMLHPAHELSLMPAWQPGDQAADLAAVEKIKVMGRGGELLAVGEVVQRSQGAAVVQPTKVLM